MKRNITILLMCGCLAVVNVSAQQKSTLVQELETRRGSILNQIRESELLLKSTSSDVAGQLNKLTAVTEQITERQRYINLLNSDLKTINNQMTQLEADLEKLEAQLVQTRDRYAASVQYVRRNSSIENKLMFVLSAKSFTQAYRRMRYVNEYSSYQRSQGQEIVTRQNRIAEKRSELDATREGKEKLLAEREQEQKNLRQQEQNLQDLVRKLQKKKRDIEKELARKRREAKQLNVRIDKLVSEEIERVSRKASKEADAKAAPPTAGTITMNQADRQLSGNFLSNRGRLPVPVTGSYAIVSRFGQYSVEGLRFVKLENKGIDIQASPSAHARAIFDGEVTSVFQVQGSGLFNILVRHGNYISVYCNLSSSLVKQGDRVKTNQLLGVIYSDPTDSNRTVLHFQLRREREQLNPEPWLQR